MRRGLAAVMAADVVGYSRLMGEDERSTLTALIAFRSEVFGPTVAGHRGAVVKNMGDGWLVTFASSVDAINCAMSIQDQIADHPILKLRIGVNIGDIVHEDEDIFGDGVNVAARLQEIAPDGGVAISGGTYDSLDGTLTPAFTDGGRRELKHIARPIHVWIRLPAGRGARAAGDAAGKDLTGFSTLAIVPIDRIGDARELDDLADALTGDLLRLLGSSDWLRLTVTSDPGLDDYVLEACLRSHGTNLKLEVDLRDPTGGRIWRVDYDGVLQDSFDWQDRVGKDIAANSFGAVFDRERETLFAQDHAEMSAEDCLKCGVLEYFEISDDSLRSALAFLKRAMARDPEKPAAYAQAVRCVFSAIAAGYQHRLHDHLPKVDEWLRRAEGLERARDVVVLCKSMWTFQNDKDPRTLLETIDAVLKRAPFDTDVLCLGGWGYVWLGRPKEAIDCFRKFQRLGQFSSFSMAAQCGLAIAFVQAGRDHAAIEQAGTLLRVTRDFSTPFHALAAAAAHIGRLPEAHDAVANILRLVPDDSLERLRNRVGFADTSANQRFFDGLRQAGLPATNNAALS